MSSVVTHCMRGRCRTLLIGFALGISPQTQAVDLTPDASRVLSDPAFVPSARQLIGATTYGYSKDSADVVGTSAASQYSLVRRVGGVSQAFSYGITGYERGAFTGAAAGKRGLFEVAHRGTIFLDEVADLALAAQAKILRVLQSGEIQKIGAERPIKVDVRVLSGTHKDLKTCVGLGHFREDLYYRLKVVPITVPSLRERAQDIPLLAAFFARRICEKNNIREKALDDAVLWELQHYRWPGNVRELHNVVERMLIMSGEKVTLADIPTELLAEDDSSGKSGPSALKEFRDNAERGFIIAALKRNHGNVSQSAVELGVGRTYLHRRLGVLQIAKKDFFV